ncbi:hypothetical protein R1flu_025773 [Riccia fluitans]|uniref:Uncharacterized protein n=1 Tax=Riccia fluitans TaxID=41844 RepID=A0ABD1Y1V1_9MARC
MAPRSSKGLKTKEVKIPHLTKANKKKMEDWMLNVVLAQVRPEHFQHNLLAIHHYAWVAINDPAAPTPNWGDAIEKIVSRQIKALGVCNEATCLGPYLAHMYNHFHEMDNEEKEDSKKRKALIQTVSNSNTKRRMRRNQRRRFLTQHGKEKQVGVGSVTAEAIAQNMEQIFAPPPVVEVDVQPWKEMVKNLIKVLTAEQKKNWEVVEQRDYFKGKMHRSKKMPEIAMWCA